VISLTKLTHNNLTPKSDDLRLVQLQYSLQFADLIYSSGFCCNMIMIEERTSRGQHGLAMVWAQREAQRDVPSSRCDGVHADLSLDCLAGVDLLVP